MTDDTYAQGVREIEALRARLAHLEDIARQPRAGTMLDAIADAMSPTRPTVDPRRKALENRARFYDPATEPAHRERERVGAEKYDAALAAAGGDLVADAISRDAREAFVKLGGTIPDPEEE